MEPRIERVQPVFVHGRPHPHIYEAVELWRRWGERRFGHDDFQHGPTALAHDLTDSPETHSMFWAALSDNRMVGSIHVQLPRHENRHMAELEMCVDPAVESWPVLDALWQGVRPDLVADRRTTVTAWNLSGLDDRAPTLTPATGVGCLAHDDMAGWLLARGFVLDQVERAGVLHLDDDLADLDSLSAGALAYADGYRLRQWTGITPPDLRDGMAILRGRMSTDVPLGEMPVEAQHWDAARVENRDERHLRAGLDDLWTVALDASGVPVAHTYLSVPREKPWLAWQEDTLVQPQHRGRRLGLLIKAANLIRLRRLHPCVRRVRTWNAAENTHMLAVNEALGFRTDGHEGCWVRNDDVPAGPGEGTAANKNPESLWARDSGQW